MKYNLTLKTINPYSIRVSMSNSVERKTASHSIFCSILNLNLKQLDTSLVASLQPGIVILRSQKSCIPPVATVYSL